MWAWLTENIATILLSLALAGVAAAIIAGLIRKRKKGESSCGCHCGSCPMKGSCHKEK